MKVTSVTVGSFHSNCYLLTDEKENKAALIDPGGSAVKIMEMITDSKAEVVAIILTHGHFDHVIALNEIREFTDADVYIHALDLPKLSNSRLSFLPKSFRTDAPEHLLMGNEIIDIGASKIKVLHTPGHTEGSICLVFDNGMISGDTLFYRNIGRCDLPGGDDAEMMKTLDMLAKLNISGRVYPGHGPSTTMEDEIKFNPYLRKDHI